MNAAVAYNNNPLESHNKMTQYKEIYQQYIDDASFLWLLRSIAVEQPHFHVNDMRELEQRIENQLDALMAAGETAWQLCLEALQLEESGEVFSSTIIAFKSHDAAKIQIVIDVGLKTKETFKGLVSALGWLPEKIIHNWVKKFLSSKDLNHKHLALAVCSVRRENPGDYLNKILSREDCKQHNALYARALRLVGELRRQDLMPALNEAVESDDDNIKFWSNYSTVLLGDRAAVNKLKPFVFNPGPHQIKAINIVFKVLPVDQARNWISQLGKDSTQIRAVIKASGVLGDPHAVNWLITKMREPAQAKLAAEAFCLITGLDLQRHDLAVEPAPDVTMQPNDDVNDDNISLDEDENLAYPAVEKIASIWMNYGQNFIAGQRYFMGKVITPDWLKHNRNTGNQRQRHLANLELILQGDTPLLNTRAKIES